MMSSRNSFFWRSAPALILSVLSTSVAYAQRADENVIRSAEDAFGRTLGNESIGIYDASNVRGFSPSSAGNIRVEGIYVDQPAGLSGVAQAGYAVNVGPSLQGVPFPAPTGVVNYFLRESGVELGASFFASGGPVGSYSYQMDVRVPINGELLGVAAGISQGFFRDSGGGHSNTLTFGALPTWKPAPGLQVKFLYNRGLARQETAPVVYVTTDSFVPSQHFIRDRYLGPSWAKSDTDTENSGAILSYLLGPWTVRIGGFTSAYRVSTAYSNIIFVDDMDDLSRIIVVSPGISGQAHSGELRMSRQVGVGKDLSGLITFSLRARDRRDSYGEGAQFDYGKFSQGDLFSPNKPSFTSGDLTLDSTRQVTPGLSFTVNFRQLLEVTVGTQYTSYKKDISAPALPLSHNTAKAWLFNSSLTGNLTSRLGIYASYVTGLEESGTAPSWATNANQILPAIKTMQWDGGFRWKLVNGISAIVGYFAISKPYVGLTRSFSYVALGRERHRGIEASVVASPLKGLTVLAGGVYAQNEVAAFESTADVIGRRPVAQPNITVIAGFDYEIRALEGLSFDGSMSVKGKQAGTIDNLAILPSQARFSMGARYRFKSNGDPITLRVYLDNLFNEYSLQSSGSQAYTPSGRRTLNLTCTIDF